MSTNEEANQKQEEKKELTPDPTDKDKINMKIALIPRVLIRNSPKNDQSNDPIENDPKKDSMTPLPEKEEEKVNEITPKPPENEMHEPQANEEENKMEIEPEEKKEEPQEEKKENPEKKEEDAQMKIEPENKETNNGWGADSTENKNNDGGWGGDNANSGWGNEESNANQENNNNPSGSDGWGSSEQNKNENGWDSNNNNNNSSSNNNPELEALANEMQQADDKDIREDTGPLPEAKAAADTFALCNENKENKMTWYNRDGRNNEKDPFIEKEIERLLKEHDIYTSRKQDKTSEMESLEFKAYYVKIYSNEPPEELPEKKRPKIRFDDMNKLPEELAKNVKRLKFDYLTPIQRMVMPYIQVGKDIVCIAETGSGKTVSYLFPIIGQMLISGVPENPFINSESPKEEEKKESNENKEESKDGEKKKSYFAKKTAYPLCLVLVPTRELAIQVSKESKKLSFNTGIRTVAIYGGDMKKFQTIELSKGCDIMVATPGRLIDLLEKGLISLKMVKYLIMDEADRMLDQNFYNDIKNIISHTTKRKERQNLLFSATFNDDIKGLAKYFLNNYYYFRPVLESPKQIKHDFIRVQNDEDKKNALIKFLKDPETKDKSVLIFLRTKNGVDELGNIMKEENISCCTIHGDKMQADRIKSINEFSAGKKNVLIATDVASRGLDFPSVYCVVNFDLPQTNDDYIHRVGRTGRIGQEGKALTFIDGMDETNRMKLIHFLKNQGQEVPEWIDDSISQKKYRFFAANKRKKDDEENAGEKNEDNEGFKKPFRKKKNDEENNNAGSSWDNNNENKKDSNSWGNSNSNNNSNSGWGANDSNDNKNNSGWGSNDNSNNNNSGWGSNDNSNNNNSGWGSNDNSNNNNSGWVSNGNSNNNSGWGSNDNDNKKSNNTWGSNDNSNNNSCLLYTSPSPRDRG